MSTSLRAQLKMFLAWLSIGMIWACGQPDTTSTGNSFHGVYDEQYLIHLSPAENSTHAYELQSCLVDDRGMSLRNSCVGALKTDETTNLVMPHAYINFLHLTSAEAEQLHNQHTTFGAYAHHLFNNQTLRRGASGAAAAGGVVLGGYETKRMVQHMATTKQSITQAHNQIEAATQIMNQRSLDIRDTTAELNKLKRIRLSLLEQQKVLAPDFLKGEFDYFTISNIDNRANHLESVFIKSSFRSDLPFDQAVRKLKSFLTDADLAQLTHIKAPQPDVNLVTDPPFRINGMFTDEFMHFIQKVLQLPSLADRLTKNPDLVAGHEWNLIKDWVNSDPTLAHVIDKPFLAKYQQYHDLQAALTSRARELSTSQLFDHFHEFSHNKGVPPELKGSWLWMKRYRRYIIPHRKLLTAVEQNASTTFKVNSSTRPHDVQSLRSKEQHLLTERLVSLDDRINKLTTTKKLQLDDFTMGTKSIRDAKFNLTRLNTRLKRAPKFIGLLAIGTTIFTGSTLKLMLSTFNGDDKASAELWNPHHPENVKLILAYGSDLAKVHAETHTALTLASAADMLKAVAHFYNTHTLEAAQKVRAICLPQRTGPYSVTAQCDQLAAL